MSDELKNEVQTSNHTPQSIPMETEKHSSVPTTNDNTDNSNLQVTNDSSTKLTKTNGNFYSGTSLRYSEFATTLIKKHHIVTINNMLYIYIKGVYVNNLKAIKQLLYKYAPNAKPSDISTMFSVLQTLAPEVDDKVLDYRYVAFDNKIVNVKTLEVMDFDPKYIITSRVFTNYIEDVSTAPGAPFSKKYLHSLSCRSSRFGNFRLRSTWI